MNRKLQRMYNRRRKLRIQALIAVVIAAVLLLCAWRGSVWAGANEQQIRLRFGQKNYEVEGEAGPQYFESNYSDPEKLRADAGQICQDVAEEGIVLLRNEDNILPLNSHAKISVFGSFEDDSLKEALEEGDIQVNDKLWSFDRRGGGTAFSKGVENSFEEYPDAAVVVLTRREVEENVPAPDETGDGQAEAEDSAQGETVDGQADAEAAAQEAKTSLSLTEQEEELLESVCGAFDNVIVVLDTDNPPDMEFLKRYEIRGCLWTGAIGAPDAGKEDALRTAQIKALAGILKGDVNPSGRLPDTWLYSALSAPAAMNVGDFKIANSSVDHGTAYLDYAEGIYVGYRYFETRYEDSAAGAGDGFVYDEEVAFPFGFGLSYTKFTLSGMDVEFVKGKYQISVDVTNTGSKAGKEVVQIYLQCPYTDFDRDNGIEVPSVELAGFAKTEVLQPGEAQTVTVVVDGADRSTFDQYVHGGYITEAGTYYLTAAQNAHEAVSNILRFQDTKGSVHGGSAALVSKIEQKDTESGDNAGPRGGNTPVSMKFKDADPASWNEDYTPFSRKDWTGTWPAYSQEGNWEAPAGFIDSMRVSSGEDPNAAAPVYNSPHGDENTPLIALRGIEDDDYRWNNLLDQLSWRETYSLVGKGGGLLNEVLSCSSPQALTAGYASGLDASYDGKPAMRYPSAPILAATWNESLIEEMASIIGEEALAAGITLWQTPSLNLHRTSLQAGYGDMFSEDSCLTGKMAAAMCRGLSEHGVIPVLGRFVLAEQRTNYEGGAILVGEQALRELYLESFRLALREGGDGRKAVMAGANRIGARWCGGSANLITGILRGEWGFNGFVMTDEITADLESYCDILEGLEAGTDVWQNTSGDRISLRGAQMTYGVRARFRAAAGRILQSLVYSNSMNGMGEETRLKYSSAPWKYWRLAIDVVLAILAALCLWFALAQLSRIKRLNVKIQVEEKEWKRQERGRRST